jgi:hypothetical protein
MFKYIKKLRLIMFKNVISSKISNSTKSFKLLSSMDDYEKKKFKYKIISSMLILVSLYFTNKLFADYSDGTTISNIIFIIYATSIDLFKIYSLNEVVLSITNRRPFKFLFMSIVFILCLSISIAASASYMKNISNKLENTRTLKSQEYKDYIAKKEIAKDTIESSNNNLDKYLNYDIMKDSRIVALVDEKNSLPKNYITAKKEIQKKINFKIDEITKEVEDKIKISNDNIKASQKILSEEIENNTEVKIKSDKIFDSLIIDMATWYNSKTGKETIDTSFFLALIPFLISFFMEISALIFNNLTPEYDKVGYKNYINSKKHYSKEINKKENLNNLRLKKIIAKQKVKDVFENAKQNIEDKKEEKEVLEIINKSNDIKNQKPLDSICEALEQTEKKEEKELDNIDNLETKEKEDTSKCNIIKIESLKKNNIKNKTLYEFIEYIYNNSKNGKMPGRDKTKKELNISISSINNFRKILEENNIINIKDKKASKLLGTKEEALKKLKNLNKDKII